MKKIFLYVFLGLLWCEISFSKETKLTCEYIETYYRNWDNNQFGDTINEGPAGEYAKAYSNVKKTYGAFWDSIHAFESLLKSKGLGKHAKELNKQYKVGVEKFYKFFFKMMDKLQ